MASITKDEAIQMAIKLMHDHKPTSYEKEAWHFGRVELAELLSAIYGEKIMPKELAYNQRKP